MRYFIPDLVLPTENPVGGMEKLGGAPCGLAVDAWPRCSDCGGSQTLLAQLVHDPHRLDLGRAGRMLFVFQCMHEVGACATWEAGSGANACLVVEPEDVTGAPTPLPDDDPWVDPEVAIRGWIARDDGVADADGDAFLSGAYLSLDEERRGTPSEITHLGGVPAWLQSADEAPPGWRFVGQLDSVYSFMTPPAAPGDAVRPDPRRAEERTHFAPGPNFGGGIAYLFAREASGVPELCMLWQC